MSLTPSPSSQLITSEAYIKSILVERANPPDFINFWPRINSRLRGWWVGLAFYPAAVLLLSTEKLLSHCVAVTLPTDPLIKTLIDFSQEIGIKRGSDWAEASHI